MLNLYNYGMQRIIVGLNFKLVLYCLSDISFLLLIRKGRSDIKDLPYVTRCTINIVMIHLYNKQMRSYSVISNNSFAKNPSLFSTYQIVSRVVGSVVGGTS
jgi:hypothetical protein